MVDRHHAPPGQQPGEHHHPVGRGEHRRRRARRRGRRRDGRPVRGGGRLERPHHRMRRRQRPARSTTGGGTGTTAGRTSRSRAAQWHRQRHDEERQPGAAASENVMGTPMHRGTDRKAPMGHWPVDNWPGCGQPAVRASSPVGGDRVHCSRGPWQHGPTSRASAPASRPAASGGPETRSSLSGSGCRHRHQGGRHTPRRDNRHRAGQTPRRARKKKVRTRPWPSSP